MRRTLAPLPAWGLTLGLVLVTWAAIAALLRPTLVDMVALWERSETYAHGYVILPLALWLLWRQRRQLAALPARPEWRALFVAMPALLLWLAARASGIVVLEQYALVGLCIVATWGILGTTQGRAMAFPLLFLLLMVPNGDFLIPPLIEFTADFTVAALRIIGIPVYREGAFFSIPSGDWSVVEACSGLRYLISSATLGLIYAYLTYRSLHKRMLFTLAAVAVPILANGARAVMIVLIGHYSDMTLAMGVDHFIYGWVWFGLVMLVMFWVGLAWREDLQHEEAPPASAARAPRLGWGPALALVAMTSAVATYSAYLNDQPAPPGRLLPPPPAAGWQVLDDRGANQGAAMGEFASWEPHWTGMDQRLIGRYGKGKARVLLYVAWYGTQRQGAELISSLNQFVPELDPSWQNTGEATRSLSLAGVPVQVRQAVLRSPHSSQRILAWQWHRMHGMDGVNALRAKLRLAWLKLSGQGDAAAAVIVAAPYQEHREDAEAALQDFLTAMGPAITRMIDAAQAP